MKPDDGQIESGCQLLMVAPAAWRHASASARPKSLAMAVAAATAKALPGDYGHHSARLATNSQRTAALAACLVPVR